MYRFLLTPRWWGINVFVVLAIPFCVFMGSWQLSRFEDRMDAQHSAEQAPAKAAHQRAAPLRNLLPVDQKTSGRTAETSGRYVRQLLVPGRVVEDKQGFYVLGLLRTDGGGGDKGKVLPVVRGWVPGHASAAKAPALPTGEVSVRGALQSSENTGTDGVSTSGGLPQGQLGMISAASLVNLTSYDVYDAWITLDKGDSGMRAVPAAAPPDTGLDLKAFQNLGYTGEWFVFAGFVVFMWFRLLRREAEAARDEALGIPAPEPEPFMFVTGSGGSGGSVPAPAAAAAPASAPASAAGGDAAPDSASAGGTAADAAPTDEATVGGPVARSGSDTRG
ncbi:SURF1 family protein [Streptomyces tsukubensis]|uniref:SURF1 family protein n=1 Tax=Streptomyces tsukubensis TaxID=83656 RepID=UPI00098EAF7A|nr:SURF1 family protein [Streptomyces tsukubensis]QFR94842.1 SURF1 family protein [Streptomyces tsukubensis]